jgi:predicted glycogen debranching enzyme
MRSVRPSGPSATTAVAAPLAGDAEWLLGDGAGGYACGSADDLPRRRYHGLWIARPVGDSRRRAVVSGLDERVVDGARVTFLAHVQWQSGARSTPGASVAFAPRPLPAWTFRGDGFALERTIALRRAVPGVPPACLVRWHNHGDRMLRLHVRPLLGWCDADHLRTADERNDGSVLARGASWGVRPDATLPVLWLTADGVAALRADAAWYRGFDYATDAARGYDHVGDRWTPGVLEFEIGPGRASTLAFALGEPCADPAAAFATVAAAAVRSWREALAKPVPWVARVARAADDFLFRDDTGRPGVLAGFPWFAEWGRDSFVALPGLTLARGQRDLCAEVLRSAVPFLRRGLLPNVYGRTTADSHYDSCDAALWWSLAVQRYADAGGDAGLLRRELLPALADVARAYEKGSDLGVRVDGDGLLAAGRADLNATWMDARIGTVPVTPRAGLPVEIQALWYSLLAFLAEHDAAWTGARDRCGASFVRQFWLADGQVDGQGGWLADRVHGGAPVREVRPNMVIAAALPRSPLSEAQRAGVVQKARAELVTPVGLRTLSPLDAAYRGRYEGAPEARDSAYHQGTAWPWLAGFWVEASLAAAGASGRAKLAAALRAWLAGFAPELDRAGIDHVSEVFDGDPPHRPGGTFAQAWNTGELLRAWALVAEAPA